MLYFVSFSCVFNRFNFKAPQSKVSSVNSPSIKSVNTPQTIIKNDSSILTTENAMLSSSDKSKMIRFTAPVKKLSVPSTVVVKSNFSLESSCTNKNPFSPIMNSGSSLNRNKSSNNKFNEIITNQVILITMLNYAIYA